MTDGRGQTAEGRGQRAEDRRQRAEGRGRRAEGGGRRAEAEGGGRRAEGGGQTAESDRRRWVDDCHSVLGAVGEVKGRMMEAGRPKGGEAGSGEAHRGAVSFVSRNAPSADLNSSSKSTFPGCV